MALYAPLRECVFTGSSESVVSIVSKLGSFRPAQYKDWSAESMVAAMKLVIEDGMSVCQAAELHRVPKSTLGD